MPLFPLRRQNINYNLLFWALLSSLAEDPGEFAAPPVCEPVLALILAIPWSNIFPSPPLGLPLTGFIRALPLLKQTFPPSTLVINRISSHPSLISPVFQISMINLSPGLTGDANRHENSLMFLGSLPPIAFKSACAVKFHDERPCMMGPPNPIFCPGSGVACKGL